MITGLPGATSMKPGSASLPFFGIVPAIVDEDGNELLGECNQGYLVCGLPNLLMFKIHRLFYTFRVKRGPVKYMFFLFPKKIFHSSTKTF